MHKIGKKRRCAGREAQETSNTEALIEIPSDLSELSIPELKNLCRSLNFSCAGGRRVLIKRLENERDRLGTNTQQANIEAAQRNNSPSVSTVRECKWSRSRRLFRSPFHRSSRVSKPHKLVE